MIERVGFLADVDWYLAWVERLEPVRLGFDLMLRLGMYAVIWEEADPRPGAMQLMLVHFGLMTARMDTFELTLRFRNQNDGVV